MPAGSFQTLTLEYRVFDQCDGTTEAPPFSEGVLDERQIYVFEVQRLGVIPLRFGEETENPALPAAPANRTLTWSLFTGVPTAFDQDSGVGIGFVERASGFMADIESVGQISAGSEGLYLRRCVQVRQGMFLRVADIEAPDVGPAIIRLRVQLSENGEQQQMLQSACCCKSSQVDINVPDGADDGGCPEFTLEDVDPSNGVAGDAPVSVTLTGTGFLSIANPQVGFFNNDSSLNVLDFEVLSDTEIQATVEMPGFSGVFNVAVGDLSIENCFVILFDSFFVAPNPG